MFFQVQSGGNKRYHTKKSWGFFWILFGRFLAVLVLPGPRGGRKRIPRPILIKMGKLSPKSVPWGPVSWPPSAFWVWALQFGGACGDSTGLAVDSAGGTGGIVVHRRSAKNPQESRRADALGEFNKHIACVHPHTNLYMNKTRQMRLSTRLTTTED